MTILYFSTAVPESTDDEIELDDDSELYYSCEANVGYLVSSTKDQSIKLILTKYFKDLSKYLNTGYFAVQKITKQGVKLTKICFQPDDMIPLTKLKELYPGMTTLQIPPSFTMPSDDKHIATIVVMLNEDKSLYAGICFEHSSKVYV